MASELLRLRRFFPKRASSSSVIRRNGTIEEATADMVLRENDVVAVAGRREVLVGVIGQGAKVMAAVGAREPLANVTSGVAIEVDDPELLNVPSRGRRRLL